MNGLVGFVLLVCLASVAHGLKCYQCASSASLTGNNGCGDDYQKPADHLTDCHAEATKCMKVKTGANGVFTYVRRSCATACTDQNVAYVTRTVCCEGDECNASGATVASAAVVIGSIVAALFLH